MLETDGVLRLRSRAAQPEEYGMWNLPISINAGACSGGVVCIDFDDAGSCYEEWKQIVEDTKPGALAGVTIQRTPSGGYHVVYKTTVETRCVKLANKAKTEEGKLGLIETRGDGGYFLCSPSEGYALLQGTFTELITVPAEDHELFLSAARSLNRDVETHDAPKKKGIGAPQAGLTPFDDYDSKHDPMDLLISDGWSVARTRGEAIYLRRPGKKEGVSGSWNYVPGRFFCFTSATAFQEKGVYKPSAVYAILKHGGDWSAAARELRKLGYGVVSKTANNDEVEDESEVPKKKKAKEPVRPPVDYVPERLTFDMLGFIEDKYIYRRRADGQMIVLSHNEHVKTAFYQLATTEEWKALYGLEEDDKKWAEYIQAVLIGQSIKKGRFDDKKVRGVGAWIDDGFPVYNTGDKIKSGSGDVRIGDFKTKFFYNQSSPIYPEGSPKCHPEIKDVFEIMGFSECDKMLFGGWCTIAPICGSLRWRPHAWLTADRGGGKSTLVETVVRPLVEHCVYAKSSTSEAGIRQSLKNNSIPVIFDEAETKNMKTRENMDRVIELARMASDNSGHIQKGSTSGKVIEYTVRSCFFFASIATGIKEGADKSRISVFEYHKVDGKQWEKLSNMITKVLTFHNCNEHRLRIISLMSNILKSIEVITKEVVALGEDSRSADQYSPMIAGWWHIDHDDVIDQMSAITLVARIENEEFKTKDKKGELDSEQCLEAIFTTAIVCGSQRIGIRRVIQESIDETNENSLNRRSQLSTYGIKVVSNKGVKFVAINSKNTEFGKLMKTSQFEFADYSRLLGRIAGVLASAVVSMDSKPQRCILIPLSMVIDSTVEAEQITVAF